MHFLVRALAVLLLLCGEVCAWASAGDDGVVILLEEPTASATEFASRLEANLARASPSVAIQRIDNVEHVPASARLVVAIGVRSFRSVIGRGRTPPVLGALVPSMVYDEGLPRGRTSALFLDQPPARQIALLSVLLPEAKRIGVLISRPQRKALGPLTQAVEAARQQLQVSVVEHRDGLFEALQQLTAKSDVLLAWPDAAVFNPQTIQSILLTTYRQQVPMLGFSAAYTKAGALASIHSPVPQMAEQTAEMVRVVMTAGSLPPPQFPRDFEITLNRQVARSLGITLPDETRLAEQVTVREAKLRP